HHDGELRTALRRPVLAVVGLAAAAIVVWQHPWRDTDTRALAHRLSDEAGRAVVVVTGDAFVPEWSRVTDGSCLLVEHRGTERFETRFGTLEPGERGELCFPDEGVFRVHLGGRPYSGGFVDVAG